jgi:hypothetical protein
MTFDGCTHECVRAGQRSRQLFMMYSDSVNVRIVAGS